LTRGKLVQAIALLIGQPQIAAAVERDRFKMHKLWQRDTKYRVNVLTSRGQTGDLLLVESENLTVAALPVISVFVSDPQVAGRIESQVLRRAEPEAVRIQGPRVGAASSRRFMPSKSC
jgi:hypothetical protein